MTQEARWAGSVMAAVGVATLAATGQVGPVWVMIGSAALLANVVVDIMRLDVVIAPRWANTLIVSALAFAVFDYLRFAPSLLHVGSHLLIALMMTRLRPFNAREFQQLIVIVFLQMVAAAGFAPQGAFNPGFIAYLVVMAWVLIQYHLLAEVDDSLVGREDRTQGLWIWTSTAALLAFISTAVLFLLIPRMELELAGSSSHRDIRLSGFSLQVQLGAIGPVKRDPTVVMRVAGNALGPGHPPLYLRGAVFDAFDGHSWTTTVSSHRAVPSDGEEYFAVRTHAAGTEHISIETAGLDTSVVFVPAHTAAVRGPFSSLLIDAHDILSQPSRIASSLRYDAWIAPATHVQVHQTSLPGRYLAAPHEGPIARLAADTADQFATEFDKAGAIEQFLKNRYTYSLDIPGGERQPLETFLFDRQAGYCEHFASAMTIMLRTLGIPTRLVTGFLVQEWNAFGKYAIVRQGDAHAWVEAYLPESGWTRFDPTPSVPSGDRPWEGTAVHYFDSLQMGWERYVAKFSLRDQHVVIQHVEHLWEGIRTSIQHTTRAAIDRIAKPSPLVWIAGGVVAALLVGTAMFARRRTSILGRLRKSELAETDFYRRLLHILDQRGIIKPDSHTPGEFATDHADRLPCGDAIRRVTAAYYGVRFGRHELSNEDRRILEVDLAAIADDR